MTSLALSVVLQAAVLGASEQDYSVAYQRSVQSGRPLVVLLGTAWCPSCQVMKGKVLPEVAKAGGLREVEFAYVDYDRQPELADQLARGNSTPQLIWFSRTAQGWRSDVLTGAQSPKKVASFINQGVARAAAHGRPAARLSGYEYEQEGANSQPGHRAGSRGAVR